MKKNLIITILIAVLAGCSLPNVGLNLKTFVTPPPAAQTEKAPAKDVPVTQIVPTPAAPPLAAAGDSEIPDVQLSPLPRRAAITVAAVKIVWPIADAEQRITKKPFGLQVSPQNSPVQPEKFSGYHSGVDFETFADEQDKDIEISAICDGKILVRRTASGYGGVLVESCQLDGAPVTVIYGHIRLASVKKMVGDELKAGESFAVLGTGYSSETDGERKHLHLGIHKGVAMSILGYVQSQSALSGWIDFQKYMNGLKN